MSQQGLSHSVGCNFMTMAINNFWIIPRVGEASRHFRSCIHDCRRHLWLSTCYLHRIAIFTKADLLKLDHDWFYLPQAPKTKGLVASQLPSQPLFWQVVAQIFSTMGHPDGHPDASRHSTSSINFSRSLRLGDGPNRASVRDLRVFCVRKRE